MEISIGDQEAGVVGARAPQEATSRKRFYVPWGIGIAVLLVYMTAYGVYISKHTAVPYSDESNYAFKAYMIADRGLHFWNAYDLLQTPTVERGVLLPYIAAEVGGPDADPREFAAIWLIVRSLALAGGIALIASATKRQSVVPGLFVLILGVPIFMTFRSLYMMDQPFACFALLVFGAVIWDDVRSHALSSWIAGIAVVALFLVKPVAPVLIGPLLVVRGVRELMRWRRNGIRWGAAIGWASGYFMMVAIMAILMFSPYGEAMRKQYRLGDQGLWVQPMTFSFLTKNLATLIPTSVGIGIVWYLLKRWRSPNGWVLLYAGILGICWMVFNFGVLYATDERLIAPAMPILAAGVLVVLADEVVAFRVVTGIAAVTAVLNLLIVTGALGGVDLGTYACLFSIQETRELPVEDPGTRQVARELASHLRQPDFGGSDAYVWVLYGYHYSDTGALHLAVRELHQEKKAAIDFTQVGFWMYRAPFPIDDFIKAHWYLTGGDNQQIELGGEYYLTQHAAEVLLTDAKSPIARLLDKTSVVPLSMPSVISSIGRVMRPPMEGQVTLWHLQRDLTPEERGACMEFVLPIFKNSAGHAEMGGAVEGGAVH